MAVWQISQAPVQAGRQLLVPEPLALGKVKPGVGSAHSRLLQLIGLASTKLREHYLLDSYCHNAQRVAPNSWAEPTKAATRDALLSSLVPVICETEPCWPGRHGQGVRSESGERLTVRESARTSVSICLAAS